MKKDITFSEYINKSSFALNEYFENVYYTCNKISKNKISNKFDNIIINAFKENKPINEVAVDICLRNDKLIAESKETFDEFKLKVFKYIDKRVDIDKIKELGKYIKEFIKQEYDKGTTNDFNVSESILNYVRMEYPEALKPLSYGLKV